MSSSRDCGSTSTPDPRRPRNSVGQGGVGTCALPLRPVATYPRVMTVAGGSAVWDAGAGRDPRREALEIEAAIRDVLARNTRLPDHRITVHAGPDGLVTLTGSVPTQDLRREVELSCWTVPGVRSLHDDLHVGQ
jgi:osmotically-inducible protein OsmY